MSLSSSSTSLASPASTLIHNPNQHKNNSLILNTSIQGIQLFSLLTPLYSISKSITSSSPPPSITTTASTKPKFSRLSPTIFFKRLTVGTFLIGGLGGAGIGFLLNTIDLGNPDIGGKAGRGWRKGEVRRRDYSIIGGVVGSLAITTIFLRRIPIYYLVPGSASLGIAGGIITDLVETFNVGEKVIDLERGAKV